MAALVNARLLELICEASHAEQPLKEERATRFKNFSESASLLDLYTLPPFHSPHMSAKEIVDEYVTKGVMTYWAKSRTKN